jgi:hypothetical protein
LERDKVLFVCKIEHHCTAKLAFSAFFCTASRFQLFSDSFFSWFFSSGAGLSDGQHNVDKDVQTGPRSKRRVDKAEGIVHHAARLCCTAPFDDKRLRRLIRPADFARSPA